MEYSVGEIVHLIGDTKYQYKIVEIIDENAVKVSSEYNGDLYYGNIDKEYIVK